MKNESNTLHKLQAELAQTKAALKECREQSDLLTEQSLLAILIMQDEKVVYANRAYAQLTGYGLKEILNWTSADTVHLIHPDYRDFALSQAQKKMSGAENGIVYHYKYLGINKNGEENWVDQYSKTVTFNGKPANMVTLINITDRINAETALREGWEKYQALVDNVNDALVILQDNHIVFHNVAAERETGYKSEELCDMSFIDVIHPEDRDIIIDRYLKRLAGEEIPTTYSFRIIRKTKDILWGQVNAAVITWEGQPATLCVIRDITRIKELEDRLRDSRKMETISTLSGGLAHNFNNILFPIIGFSELMIEETTEGSSFHNGLSQILKAAKRGRDIVKEFAAFSREMDQEAKVMDVKPVILNVLKLLKASLPSNIKINTDIEVPCGLVNANPTQLQQVILNLSKNALQAMEKTGGQLNIQLSTMNLDTSELENTKMSPGSYACLSLLDTGSGMDNSILERIFDPYFTTREQGEGAGMGLYVSLGIVRNYGGDIQVESKTGKGSLFKIYLPILDADATHVKPE